MATHSRTRSSGTGLVKSSRLRTARVVDSNSSGPSSSKLIRHSFVDVRSSCTERSAFRRVLATWSPSLDALAKVLAAARPAWPDTVGRPLARRHAWVRRIRARPIMSSRCGTWLNAWNCRIPYPTDGVDPLVPVARRVVEVASPPTDDVPLPDLDDRGLDAYATAYDELVDLPAGVNSIGIVQVSRTDRVVEVVVGAATADRVAVGRGDRQGRWARHATRRLPPSSPQGAATGRITSREPAARGIDDVAAHVGRHSEPGEDLRRVVLPHVHSRHFLGCRAWMSRICAYSSTTTSG